MNRWAGSHIQVAPAFVNVYGQGRGTRATIGRRSLQPMRPDELERRLRKRLDALGPAPRAELLRVPMLPDFERADRIGEFLGEPEDADLRRAADRLRGAPDASGGACRMLRKSGPGHRRRFGKCDTWFMFNLGPLEATVVIGFFLAIGMLIASFRRR
jgi:hypothetical protein